MENGMTDEQFRIFLEMLARLVETKKSVSEAAETIRSLITVQ